MVLKMFVISPFDDCLGMLKVTRKYCSL